MGSQTREDVGFPSNQVKGDDYRYNPGCGGSGAGVCVLPAAFSFVYWSIKVNPFSSRNNMLVLHDDDFLVYTNAGSDGICPNSNGSRVAFDVLLFYQSPAAGINEALATAKVNVPTSQALPFDIEFTEGKIPQPTNVLYERKIWVAINFAATGLMIGGLAQNTEAMQTVKLDYEARP